MSTPNIDISPSSAIESSYFLSTIDGLKPFVLQCRDNSNVESQLTADHTYFCIYIFAELLLIVDDNGDPTYFFPYHFCNADLKLNRQEYIEQ